MLGVCQSANDKITKKVRFQEFLSENTKQWKESTLKKDIEQESTCERSRLIHHVIHSSCCRESSGDGATLGAVNL